MQLRRTGLVIASVMMAGGALVMAAYLMKLKAEERDDRPHIVGRLTQAFGGRNQDGKAFATSMLEGKISLVTAIAGKEKARTAEALRVMKLVAEKFAGDDGFRFVGITVDPEADGPEELKGMLEELGVADDPRWIYVQAEEKNAVGYLRSKMRLETVESIVVDGEKVKRFRSGVVMLDPNLHVLEPQYDFNLAKEVQEDAKRILAKDPGEAERLQAERFTAELQKAEESLFTSINYIREGNLKEGK